MYHSESPDITSSFFYRVHVTKSVVFYVVLLVLVFVLFIHVIVSSFRTNEYECTFDICRLCFTYI